jgi:hypothetical protein
VTRFLPTGLVGVCSIARTNLYQKIIRGENLGGRLVCHLLSSNGTTQQAKSNTNNKQQSQRRQNTAFDCVDGFMLPLSPVTASDTTTQHIQQNNDETATMGAG